VVDTLDNHPSVLFSNVFDHAIDYFTPESVPQLVVLLGDYQYKYAFVADQEINMVAFLTEVMASCEVK
jgi:hypothetical protein